MSSAGFGAEVTYLQSAATIRFWISVTQVPMKILYLQDSDLIQYDYWIKSSGFGPQCDLLYGHCELS